MENICYFREVPKARFELEGEVRSKARLNSWIKYGRKLHRLYDLPPVDRYDSFVDIRGIDFARTPYIKSFKWSTSKYPWILFKPIPVELQGSSSPEESGSRREVDFLLSNSILSRAVLEKRDEWNGYISLHSSILWTAIKFSSWKLHTWNKNESLVFLGIIEGN